MRLVGLGGLGGAFRGRVKDMERTDGSAWIAMQRMQRVLGQSGSKARHSGKSWWMSYQEAVAGAEPIDHLALLAEVRASALQPAQTEERSRESIGRAAVRHGGGLQHAAQMRHVAAARRA